MEFPSESGVYNPSQKLHGHSWGYQPGVIAIRFTGGPLLKNRFLFILVMAVLTACGGGGTSIDVSTDAQQKATHPSLKQSAASYQNAVESLYVAYFGRPADPNGLTNFEAALQAAGAPTDVAGLAAAYSTNPTIKSLVDSFGLSTESQNLYGNGTTAQFVATIFNNVLGRQPAASGSAFWINAIDSGLTSRGDAALSIMAGAFGNSTPQGALDAQLINNKTTVAGAFTNLLTSNRTASTYSGATAGASGRTLLRNIVAGTNTAEYQANVRDAVAAIANNTPYVPGGYTISVALGNLSSVDYFGLAISDGVDTVSIDSLGQSVTFPTPILPGNPYNVIVTGQPYGYETSCWITLGSGIVTAGAVENVGISCTTLPTLSYYAGSPAGIGDPANPGNANGPAAAASFSDPVGLGLDSKGNLYVADYLNNLVRKIAPDGTVSTFAGTGEAGYLDGPASSAMFNWPVGIAVDSNDNVFVSEDGNSAIRKISPDGTVSTYALSGTATILGVTFNSRFLYPNGIAVDGAGNVYVADTGNNLIRKISPQGVVSVLAGTGVQGAVDGSAATASFNWPKAVAVDKNGNVYVADSNNDLIRMISPAGTVSTLAGHYDFPSGIAVDASGNIFVGDSGNNSISMILPPAPGQQITIAGQIDGSSSNVGMGGFSYPTGIAVDANHNVYVSDSINNLIRKIAGSSIP